MPTHTPATRLEFPVSKHQTRLRIRARGGPGLCPYFHIPNTWGEYFSDQLNYLFCDGREPYYPPKCGSSASAKCGVGSKCPSGTVLPRR